MPSIEATDEEHAAQRGDTEPHQRGQLATACSLDPLRSARDKARSAPCAPPLDARSRFF